MSLLRLIYPKLNRPLRIVDECSNKVKIALFHRYCTYFIADTLGVITNSPLIVY